MVNQIRADFGTLEQLQADQGLHAGNIQEFKATLKGLVQQALANFDGGIGTDEHAAVMRKVDELIDEHINTTQSFQRSTRDVTDTFQASGQQARSILGSGA